MGKIPLFFLLIFFSSQVFGQQPVLKIPTAHTAWITAFDVSHNGKYIATGSVDFTVKIWDYRTKKELKVLRGHKGSVNAVCFSPNDSLVASAGNDTKIKIWNIRTGECVRTMDSMFSSFVNDLCFSSDGKFIAGCSNNEIGVYDLYRKRIVESFWTGTKGNKIRFFPGTYNLAFASADSEFSVYSFKDTFSYVQPVSFHYKHGAINDFFISGNGKYIFSAVNTPITNIRMRAVQDGSLPDSIRFAGHMNPAKAICAGENDQVFYSMSDIENPLNVRWDIEIKKWSVPLKKCIDSFYLSDKNNAIIDHFMKLSPGNDILFANYQVVFFQKPDHQTLKKISSRTTINNGVLDTGDSLILTSEDGIIRIFNKANNSITIRNTGGDFSDTRIDGNKMITTLEKHITGKDYLSKIISYDLQNNSTDTILEENGYIDFSPGLTITDDRSRVAYKLNLFKDGKLLKDSSRFKIWDLKEKRIIYNTSALTISDLKFLPDNRSYVLCTNLSNKLFLIRDTITTIFTDSGLAKNDRYCYLQVLDQDHVICSDNRGFTIWDLKNNRIENKVALFAEPGRYLYPVFIKLSKNKERLLLAQNDTIKLFDLKGNRLIQTFSGDLDWVNQLAFSNDSNEIISASIDNSIRFWDVSTAKEKYKMVFIDSSDWIIVSTDGYYQSTTAAARSLHYATANNRIISFEQLDVRYNRPDMVLTSMGNTDSMLIRSFRKAWEKRIKKLGIDTTTFRSGYSVPECDITNRDIIEYEQNKGALKLRIKGIDSIYKLDRFNIWVNEVPLFGQRGINIRRRNRNRLDTTITILLSQGENRIESSVTNVNGTESYRMPLLVNYTPAVKQTVTTHFIGIGIDRFKDSKNDLRYSSKDIRDLSLKLKAKYGTSITIDTLFNENVTVTNVKALKQKLRESSVNDKVIISYSGHGLLSKDFDYYLSTYDMNFEKPEQGGLPYDELENLLDSIPARKKLMLIDACHSGEVDKDELVRINKASDSMQLTKGGITVAYEGEGKLGMKNSFELMQNLFVNVGKSTGATIISAAAGTQFALERGDLKNGVFTYCILEAMEKNKTMKISELKKIVGLRVEELTNGLQKPTSRNENIAVDWSLW